MVWFGFPCEIAIKLCQKIIILEEVLFFGLIHCDSLGVTENFKQFFHRMRIFVSVDRF